MSCVSQVQIEGQVVSNDNDTLQVDTLVLIDVIPEYTEFDRTNIKSKLQSKIENDIPLVVHVLVPLCDNIHQGIVPTSASLGDGFSLRTNLYWATSHGMKRYFKELRDWKILSSQVYLPNSVVLERVVFEKTYTNGAKVKLIAEAYRGDKIENCLLDFFNSLSGTLRDTVFVDGDTLLTHSKADLIVYNGHNGLMDVWVDDIVNVDGIQKDAAVIACSSMYNFNRKLNYAKGYPLVMTTNSLYPGAFIVEGIIDNWATLESEEKIRQSAGDAYNRVKKCGIIGARNLFSTGW